MNPKFCEPQPEEREMKILRRPYFFHCFNLSSSSHQLKVPSEFVKHIEDQKSGRVTLVGPSENSWIVDLIHQNDGLFLHNGWAAFVQDHFLEQGDALVFRYDGNLYFTVQVFDKSSCEKQAAFSAECRQDVTPIDTLIAKKREREKTLTPSDDITESVPKKLRGSQMQPGKWQLDEQASASETNQVAIGSLEMRNCSSPSKSFINFAMPLQSVVPEDNIDTLFQDVAGKESEQGSGLGTLSTSEAEELARSFNSSYPTFTKTMRAFNVRTSYTLNIPYQFGMAHLPNCKLKIVLRNLIGETWAVNSAPSKKSSMAHTLSGGWVAFVRDNNINIGDICIFELVGKCEFRVYILRGGREDINCPHTKIMKENPAFSLTSIEDHTQQKPAAEVTKTTRSAPLTFKNKTTQSAPFNQKKIETVAKVKRMSERIKRVCKTNQSVKVSYVDLLSDSDEEQEQIIGQGFDHGGITHVKEGTSTPLAQTGQKGTSRD